MQLSQTVLKAYLKRLTNLSSRNRSLLLTSLPVEQFLDLHETDFLDNKPSFDLIRQLMARRPTIPLCDVLDPRMEKANEVSKKLRKIARTDRFIEAERGSEDLYVGYPFVRGKLADGTAIHGPLVFFPVHLQQQGNKWLLVRRADEPITLNRSFLMAYAYYNQYILPDTVLEHTLDEYDKDATVFRTQLYEWLKESPLEINFNQDLFTDQLQWFNALKKSDLDKLERSGELKLYPEAVLGIFPQAGSYLVPDYEELLAADDVGHRLEGIDAQNIEHGFPFAPLPSTQPLIREENLHTPLAIDASQEEAIRRIKTGESMVVQGPPGTGKSQLIGNLMADFAAQGKRVLLVCQKRAALDVVHERLRQVGMQPFSALIHDFKNDRKALYDQLAGQVERVEEYRKQNYGLDAILLERNFDQESRRIDQTLTELQAFKDALFDETEAGISVKQLYLTSDPTAPTIPLEDIYTQFRPDSVTDFVERLREYGAYLNRLGPTHPWADRLSFAPFSFNQLPALKKLLQDLPGFVRTTSEQAQALTNRPFSLSDWQTVQEDEWETSALLTLLKPEPSAQRWHWVRRLQQEPTHPLFRTEPEELERLEVEISECLSGNGIEKSLPVSDLPNTAQRLQEAIQSRSSLLGRTVWGLFSKDKTGLQHLAEANGFALSDETLPVLLERVQRRIRFELLRQQIEQKTKQDVTPENAFLTVRLGRQALEIVRRMKAVPWLSQLPESALKTVEAFAKTARHLLETGRNVALQLSQWQLFLSESQIGRLWQEPAQTETLMRSLEQDVDLLIEADRLKERFSDTEREIVQRLGEPLSVERFLNSLHLAWIEHLETRYPILRSVSSLKMSQLETALQESVQKKQALSRQILLVKLRERTYQNLAFNRLNNLVTYRDLNHQVTKKRNIWPVRKLMEQFSEEVFQLVPCWMASPESVSAIFPMKPELFDLVIFDEASQCFAENGIPAMYRAKQVVITGDSKQLQPSDLYRIRFETAPDEETPVELEVESLLDLTTHYFPQTQLRGHYRSRSMDLIDFSNRLFYKNSLQLLPDFHQLNRQQPAIRYLNVKGVWENNTNETEARAVADLIDQLATELPGRSVGVVTFNFQQQQLIQELLEERTLAGLQAGSSPVLPSPESVTETTFVKNIENVQGDERDVIIFSIGYAPDPRGRLSAQFGSLNAKGGENRLNVAVTRARERIYVVTSIYPQQLNVENTANEGPKALKQYLEYALSVAEGAYCPQPRQTDRIPGARLLKDELKDTQPGLVEELPFADLTKKLADHYAGLLLTDDDLYYESSPKDAHAYTPFALRMKNWPFQRIYSREYWRGRIETKPTVLPGPPAD
ncbi:AAA domain-containing protein [Larkinella arboricola]|uniref:AAA domain-containing protein n=1 Tax=Larkinella arboricola TaxID=643671 RepID=A0A327X3E3_LARAB|nr:AAA domain-containing protein [Larkinella arboricola]RAJ97478.1 AAA domain-containing protein [Larkinella arboricola]